MLRIKSLYLLLFTVVILIGADAFSQSAGKPVTVLCFGDSITAGSALKKGGGEVPWPALVERSSNGKIHTLNAGRGGRPTASVEEFRQTLTNIREKPDVFLVALGTNDSRSLSATCIPDAAGNIQQMIAMAREAYPQIRILIVSPTNMRKDALLNHAEQADRREKNLQDLTTAYEKLAHEIQGDFVSVYGVVPAESLAMDGIHPDAAGNEVMAKVILDALTKQVSH